MFLYGSLLKNLLIMPQTILWLLLLHNAYELIVLQAVKCFAND